MLPPAAPCGHRIIIAGGTDNPYSDNGIGNDGVALEQRAAALEFDTRTDAWQNRASLPSASMEYRGLAAKAWLRAPCARSNV